VTIYVDSAFIPAAVPNGGRVVRSRWSHLSADTVAELHEFAARLGLRRAWFQPDTNSIRGGWHYDVTAPKRALAVRLGAKEIDSFEMVEIMARSDRETQKPPRGPEPAATDPDRC
jgi:Protein of unknown function (DUF4031)